MHLKTTKNDSERLKQGIMLSVVIITFNEERNIGRCLDSVKDIADDIVVVDSFSTDKTEEICLRYKVNFIKRSWEGYALTKNFANKQAKYDWIFSIDADEALSEELKHSILQAKKSGINQAIQICRLTNYCGHWIRHSGWYPDIKLRIFDRQTSQWHGEIHEKIDTKIKPLLLTGDLLHFSYYSIDDHIKQINKFTDIAAKEAFSSGKKSSLLKIIFSPIIKFNRDYFFNLGFLDGYAGFQVCALSSFSSYLKYAKLREYQKNRKD